MHCVCVCVRARVCVCAGGRTHPCVRRRLRDPHVHPRAHHLEDWYRQHRLPAASRYPLQCTDANARLPASCLFASRVTCLFRLQSSEGPAYCSNPLPRSRRRRRVRTWTRGAPPSRAEISARSRRGSPTHGRLLPGQCSHHAHDLHLPGPHRRATIPTVRSFGLFGFFLVLVDYIQVTTSPPAFCPPSARLLSAFPRLLPAFSRLLFASHAFPRLLSPPLASSRQVITPFLPSSSGTRSMCCKDLCKSGAADVGD